MIERLYLSTVLLVAAVIWGIFLILDGVAVSISWLHHLSVVTGSDRELVEGQPT